MAQLITQSKPTYEAGTILAQIVEFSGAKTIDKVSLNLSVTNSVPKSFVVGSAGILSFAAGSFQSGRYTWAFQPILHWDYPNNWETSGTTIANTLQFATYSSSNDAALNAPCITYQLFLDSPGAYDLWGLGYTSSEGVYYSFDSDTTDMHKMVLGSPAGPPEWTKFGTFYSTAGGVHTFSLYLSDAADVVLDQWYFTEDTDFDQTLASEGLEFSPFTLSRGPFNTAVRIRDLDYGNLADLSTPGLTNVTQWLSSDKIVASGLHNYGVQNSTSGTGVAFTDGVSIEFWQIGGSIDYFPSWDFVFPDNSVGTAYISTNYGQNYTEL